MQMPDARFTVETVRGVPVVTAPEEIDITNADGLRAALLEADALRHGMLIVDMSRTQFCDTAGLHALVGAHKRARAEGGQVRLVIGGAAVVRILAITGLDSVIPYFTSLEEALGQTPAAESQPPSRSPGTLPDLPPENSATDSS
jgi:anti-sigma B factor antagonist